MVTFAFIFARGGSKGLHRKNVLSLGGKPLIVHSIDTALSIADIDNVFVSSEDDEIIEIASSAGAIVIERPIELATDTSSEWQAWRHAIEWVHSRYGEFDEFVSLPATSPLRSSYDVVSAIHRLREFNVDICISTTPANRSPYFNMVKQVGEYEVELVNKPSQSVTRRQDAPIVQDITTVVYATSPDFIISNNGIFEGKVTSISVPKERAVDIDDIYDFMMAEAIMKSNEK